MGLFLKINLKSITIIVLLTTVTISPYLIRNIIVLDTITITKSFGYNLWKGNNPKATVEGNYRPDTNLQEQIDKVPVNNYYDINTDKIYLNEGLRNIKNNPTRYIGLYLKKVLSLLI